LRAHPQKNRGSAGNLNYILALFPNLQDVGIALHSRNNPLLDIFISIGLMLYYLRQERKQAKPTLPKLLSVSFTSAILNYTG
jgi:hypothetical protein